MTRSARPRASRCNHALCGQMERRILTMKLTNHKLVIILLPSFVFGFICNQFSPFDTDVPYRLLEAFNSHQQGWLNYCLNVSQTLIC